MSGQNPGFAVECNERPKLSWEWDTEIWAPCRLGEAFTLREFDWEKTEYLYSMKASWMGEHGDGASVRKKEQLEGEYVHPIRVGIAPRPWGCCWTYEPKIKITPPVWCWKFQDDTMFGLELKTKRDGSRRKAKLSSVMIHKGRPVYCIVVETSDGESRRYYDSIPVLDPYFAPIWPDPAPVADHFREVTKMVPVTETAETVIETPQTVTNDPGAEQAPGNAEQAPGNAEQPRRVLTTSNTAELVAAFMAQNDEDAPASWTGTENRPPGGGIGGVPPPRTEYYYYYMWFTESHTEVEAYEPDTP